MASNSKLFVLLLSLAVVGSGDQEDQYAAGAGCEPGQGLVPKDPLPGCQAYMLRRCAGSDLPGVWARCCHQLREVAPYGRCEALRALHAMVEVLVEEEAPLRCKKSAMAAIAAGLPGRDECYLETRAAGAGDDGESRRCPKIVIN